MTIKEIANLAGRTERTVRRWIGATSDKTSDEPGKMSGLSKKLIESDQSKKPADYTLEETIAIIRAGGNGTLANLLAENAMTNVQGQPMTNAEVSVNRQMMQEVAAVAARAVLSEIVPAFERINDKYHQLVMHVLADKKPRRAIAAPAKPGEIGSPRHAFEAAVRRLAEVRDIGYDAAHMMVYRDIGRQEGRDFILEANGQRIIDLLEREHLLTEGIRIAREYIDMAVSA